MLYNLSVYYHQLFATECIRNITARVFILNIFFLSCFVQYFSVLLIHNSSSPLVLGRIG